MENIKTVKKEDCINLEKIKVEKKEVWFRENKDYILKLVSINTTLDTFRTNLNLLCYNLGKSCSKAVFLNKIDILKVEKLINELGNELMKGEKNDNISNNKSSN